MIHSHLASSPQFFVKYFQHIRSTTTATAAQLWLRGMAQVPLSLTRKTHVVEPLLPWLSGGAAGFLGSPRVVSEKMGDPQAPSHHGVQYYNGLMTWMIWGDHYFRKCPYHNYHIIIVIYYYLLLLLVLLLYSRIIHRDIGQWGPRNSRSSVQPTIHGGTPKSSIFEVDLPEDAYWSSRHEATCWHLQLTNYDISNIYIYTFVVITCHFLF